MTKRKRLLPFLLLVALSLSFGAAMGNSQDGDNATAQVPFEVAKIFFEFNSTDSDLGVHVLLDGEDWKTLQISDPNGRVIFDLATKGGFKNIGLTELAFEGAEPLLTATPLAERLEQFPEGEYRFSGKTVDNEKIVGFATLTHAVPAGPGDVSAVLGPGNSLVIGWNIVVATPTGFPTRPIAIAGFQVIVGSFEVTLPGTANVVTVPPAFVESLPPGVHEVEVLAIDAGGNQTITSGSFTKP
jgi:hypothetical protein